jgi:arylsulfatase A-like enzyme
VAPSINDSMINSAYRNFSSRRLIDKLGKNYPYTNERNIAEFTALYYAMVEEVDYWVGQILDAVDRLGVRNQTVIIFTSDHGVMLGGHGLTGKQLLLEEAVRVPLIVSLPQGMEGAGTTITEPVSHLDLHATILDYLGAANLDKSDGTSLRRFIEGRSYNKDYDEAMVVVESDFRVPGKSTQFNRAFGKQPNFMIRKGA